MSTDAQDRLISEKDAAFMPGMSLQTLRRVRLEGPRKGCMPAPPHVKMGRNVRYRLSAIEKFIDDHTIVTGV